MQPKAAALCRSQENAARRAALFLVSFIVKGKMVWSHVVQIMCLLLTTIELATLIFLGVGLVWASCFSVLVFLY